MLKVFLLIDCDGCRSLFTFSRFASDDPTAWQVHGGKLCKMAEADGWIESSDGNFHYCPDCLEQDEFLSSI